MTGAPDFQLHPRLQQDCLVLGRLELCRVLLMNDSSYPWLILVPERPEVREIFELTDADQMQLIRESSLLAAHLQFAFDADKLNVAAIGNLVPQLHLHHVVRYRTDPAWPAPVWGQRSPKPYEPGELALFLERLQLGRLPGLMLVDAG
jgi:diadenosine tetraphosphate (Ap4A) HIT family hydrolase